MSASYKVFPKQGAPSVHRNAACFYQHYGSIPQHEKWHVYIDKNIHQEGRSYGGYGNTAKQPLTLTVEEVQEYVKRLQDMGFKFTMVEEKEGSKAKEYVFEIPVKDNSIIGFKVLLNALRYMEEGNFALIVKKYLYFAKRRCKAINQFSRLVLAHYHGSNSNCNHTFVNWSAYHPIMTDEQVEKIVLTNNANNAVNVTLPHVNKGNFGGGCGTKETWDVWANEKSLTKIVKFYNELCAKYM